MGPSRIPVSCRSHSLPRNSSHSTSLFTQHWGVLRRASLFPKCAFLHIHLLHGNISVLPLPPKDFSQTQGHQRGWAVIPLSEEMKRCSSLTLLFHSHSTNMNAYLLQAELSAQSVLTESTSPELWLQSQSPSTGHFLCWQRKHTGPFCSYTSFGFPWG